MARVGGGEGREGFMGHGETLRFLVRGRREPWRGSRWDVPRLTCWFPGETRRGDLQADGTSLPPT